MGAGAAGAATCACAGAFEVGAVGGLIAPNFVGLSDEVDEISERLAQVGELRDAARLARRALDLLPRGSPGWIRADDIAALAELSLN